MDILDELPDLSGAPPHEVKAVADRAIIEIERLRKALQKIADWPDYRSPSHQEIARAALKEKENV